MIHHVAIWVDNIEKMKDFYVKYFNGISNVMYYNEKKNFRSYFLRFEDGSKLELMKSLSINESKNYMDKEFRGLAHIAFSVGSKERVDELTEELIHDEYILISEPRITGDGYYESCILDPELNRVEITI